MVVECLVASKATMDPGSWSVVSETRTALCQVTGTGEVLKVTTIAGLALDCHLSAR